MWRRCAHMRRRPGRGKAGRGGRLRWGGDGGMLVMHGSRGQAVSVSLTDRERAILDFERSWWSEDVEKEILVSQRFGINTAEYYRVLNDLIDRPEALAHDPLSVRRLRRLRDRRRRARLDESARTDGR